MSLVSGYESSSDEDSSTATEFKMTDDTMGGTKRPRDKVSTEDKEEEVDQTPPKIQRRSEDNHADRPLQALIDRSSLQDERGAQGDFGGKKTTVNPEVSRMKGPMEVARSALPALLVPRQLRSSSPNKSTEDLESVLTSHKAKHVLQKK